MAGSNCPRECALDGNLFDFLSNSLSFNEGVESRPIVVHKVVCRVTQMPLKTTLRPQISLVADDALFVASQIGGFASPTGGLVKNSASGLCFIGRSSYTCRTQNRAAKREGRGMIRRCNDRDFDLIWAIINDGAQRYRGVIPDDCWTEPYMSRKELQSEIDAGVEFWGYEDAEMLAGVMGLQQVQDVTLIRHAYVLSRSQKQGIGSQLLAHLRKLAKGPVLIGTWSDAVWAIRFYEKHGFRIVGPHQKERLLKRYWVIAERQIETSVVLADEKWWERGVDA